MSQEPMYVVVMASGRRQLVVESALSALTATFTAIGWTIAWVEYPEA